jgi:carbamoyltransferase
MNILGISAGFHDAAAAVINLQGDILFASQSERYTRNKNDASIGGELASELANYDIDTVAYYERPWAKQLRRLYTGEGVQWNQLTVRSIIKKQLGPELYKKIRHVHSYNHHLSHAAAGFQTSPFGRATVVVIDAIGEWDTITIWGAEYDVLGRAHYTKLWGQKYPHSIGLFYSAMTAQAGLEPNEEEYILMGMSAYGIPRASAALKRSIIDDEWEVRFKDNLHIGSQVHPNLEKVVLAASTQQVTENLIYNVMRRARDFQWSENLVYAGGVALNCLANRNLGDYFDRLYIMPSPGDSGSALGAAALAYGGRINWIDNFLGHTIPGDYPVNAALDVLLDTGIVGIASGPAEFGPRALGNRSLLADPRGTDIKDRVNEIKRRQKFRPFAPVILEEQAEQYFAMPPGWTTSPYMQTTAVCREPNRFPAIVHRDGTSRVQTVSKDCRSGIRQLLEKWYVMTDCPMLLNTSLNIRGEPIVNTVDDARRFESMYGTKVLICQNES